jgi:uncharacterized coiled-coil protein SlyX
MTNEFEKLETKVAFLEEALQQLSDEHFKQQRELMNLKDQYLDLKNRYKNQSYSDEPSSGVDAAIDEKPPHY